MYRELPQENNELVDWEHVEVVEGILTKIDEGVSQAGKPYIIYEVEQLDGSIARFFDTFSTHAIYKHCVAGDKIKVTRTGIVPSRDRIRNFYTFKVEKEESEIPFPAPEERERIDPKKIPF